jgi:hypothetical protein
LEWTLRKDTLRLVWFSVEVKEISHLANPGKLNPITLQPPNLIFINHFSSNSVLSELSEDYIKFAQLSANLIAGSAAANSDRDVGDDLDDDEHHQSDPPTTSVAQPFTITIPPSSWQDSTIPLHQLSINKTSILLKTIFKYPVTSSDPAIPTPESSGMNVFWRGGIQNLEEEMESYDLLTGSDSVDRAGADSVASEQL